MTQFGAIWRKEEGVFQSIGEVIYEEEEQHLAQYAALGNSSLHWERGGKCSIDGNMLTAWVGVVKPGVEVVL